MKTIHTHKTMEQQQKTLGMVLSACWGIFQDIFNVAAECDWWGFVAKILSALFFGALGWLGASIMQWLFKKNKR